jgi:hypothetical protein
MDCGLPDEWPQVLDVKYVNEAIEAARMRLKGEWSHPYRDDEAEIKIARTLLFLHSQQGADREAL